MEHLLYTRKTSILLHRGQNRIFFFFFGKVEVTVSCFSGRGSLCPSLTRVVPGAHVVSQICRLPSAFHLNPKPNRTIKLPGYQMVTHSEREAEPLKGWGHGFNRDLGELR